ncbi:MAG: ABC transporter substrate-binding protein [Alphaproteobacteria bacterium]|nr:ABC transporter substrate-binding protein [Alphaproteobacteria bacterium]
MTPFRLIALTTAAFAVGALLAPSAEAQKRGGTLTYTYQPEATAMSTISTTAVPVALISTKIYESLLEYEGAGMTPKPGLAESWTVSSDRLVYTFKLRAGVKWHDGKPFTSEDVKFSIEKVVTPNHSRGRTYFGNVATIETPDTHTVVFKLKAPVPYFLRAFQPSETPMMPKHGFADEELAADKIRQAKIMQNPIGTGPFKLKEWKKGSHIILERNADYWKAGRPYLDQAVMRVLPDGAARAIAVEKGEVDLAPMNALPPAEIQRLSKLPQLVASQEGSEGLGPIMWLEVNLREKPLSDVKVRQAISLAIDRAKLVDVIWYGQGKPARGPVVSGNPTHFDKTLKPFEYSPAKANKLLDEAGYKRGADGVRFKLTQNFLPYGEEWVRQAEYIKQELGKVGIQVETQSLDMGGWLKRVYTDWAYQFTSNFTHNYSDPTIGVQRAFISTNIKQGATFNNSMNYRNPRVDELFGLTARLEDGPERNKAWAEVQQIIRDELPVIFLMEISFMNVWNKRVKGLISNGISMYTGWDQVWIE